MAEELAFVFINPYTIRKSRTGGVISRYLSRTDLRLVGARMFGASRELAEEYAQLVRHADPANEELNSLIADYILREYSPDPVSSNPHRMMCLLFEGENAIQKIWDVTGSVTLRWGCGETIRETYGDYILDSDGNVTYFEPAVLVGPNRELTYRTLRLWQRHLATDSGVVHGAFDVPGGAGWEQTLVMLKPDNFRGQSLRAGNIVDLLSSTGLRMVGIKKFSMTVAQAEEFYGPVQQVLAGKFAAIAGDRATAALESEFGFVVSPEAQIGIYADLAPLFARHQFELIVEFMTGYRPSECTEAEKPFRGDVGSLAIVYEGIAAIEKIRDILGSTDPDKARPGSIRREFGSSVMVNAAHASDSPENAQREMNIIDVKGDDLSALIEKHCS